MNPMMRFAAMSGLLPALSAVAQPQLADRGAFPVGTRTVTVTRADSSTFSARLSYPATSAGTSTPVATLDRPASGFPALSFGHGFLQPVDRYVSTLDHLASHGYVVIASNSEGSLLPSHQNFANDITSCLTWLTQQSGVSGSFLTGAIDPVRLGVAGHSMGGGASMLAAAADPRIRAVVGLAAADTNPSSITAAAAITAPIRLIAGSSDTIVPASATNVQMYDRARPAKQAPVIIGGFHCGFEDVNSLGCDSGTLPRTTQLALTRRLMTEWFNLYLKGDQEPWQFVWGARRDETSGLTWSSDAGVQLAAPGAVDVLPGRPNALNLTATYTGRAPAQPFGILLDTPSQVTTTATLTPPLTPSQPEPITIFLTAPLAQPAADVPMLISLRSTADGATRVARTVTARILCLADTDDGSATGTRDRAVGIEDLLYYLGIYAAGTLSADLDDGSGTATPDQAVSIDDLLFYLARYETGC